MSNKLPSELVEKQKAAGRARQAKLTPEERRALGKLGWLKRVEKYRQPQRMASSLP